MLVSPIYATDNCTNNHIEKAIKNEKKINNDDKRIISIVSLISQQKDEGNNEK